MRDATTVAAAREERHSLHLEPGALAALKLVVGLLVLATGFYALSDDDFSRVVTAQRFAAAPRLDPSGTSWLPLPFWITGAAMMAFGRSLAVARGVALLSSALAALLVHRAALWAGASRRGAFGGAVLATSLPTAARLGVSFQPEALTAALIVLGAASLSRGAGAGDRQRGGRTATRSRRLAGALALLAASLCRYEAWAAAAVLATISLFDALQPASAPDRTPSTTPMDRLVSAVAAGIAALGPLAWALHGVSAHGDALFFLHRVAAYRRALGGTSSPLTSLFMYPWALVRAEPEATLFGAAAIAIAVRRVGWPAAREVIPSLARPLSVVAAVFVFLVAGQMIDGAPTHHVERTLLPVWTALLLVTTEVAFRLGPSGFRELPVIGTTALVVTCAALRIFGPTEITAARSAERAIGAEARRLVPAGARLAIDTGDYGYFAVMAAFGAPERAVAIDDRDPRAARKPDPFASAAALGDRLSEVDAGWVVVRRAHLAVAKNLGEVAFETDEFGLVSTRDGAGRRRPSLH